MRDLRLYEALEEIKSLKVRLENENEYLQEEISSKINYKNIICKSDAYEKVLQLVNQVAPTDTTVLITGESGTGKEVFARSIHEASPRAEKPFVAINCASIPENLLESELFGYEKGAFTGANKTTLGKIETAQGGTLFLDEIGDMPMSFQVKLLRVLQEREVRPVGSTQSVKINVRIISATHKNLQQAIIDKTFREDLYYRLNVVELELPPLSERREDIPLLAQYFLSKSTEQTDINISGFSQEAMETLISAAWPGNIRQLQNVVEQTVALSTEPIISEMLVKNALRDKTTILPSFVQARDKFERDYLAKLLRITAGNVSQAAKIAQRNRTEFYKLLNRHHLTAEAFRED